MGVKDILALCAERDKCNPYGEKHPHHPTWVLVSDIRIAALKAEDEQKLSPAIHYNLRGIDKKFCSGEVLVVGTQVSHSIEHVTCVECKVKYQLTTYKQ